MPFEKGNQVSKGQGRPKGSKDAKTHTWDDIGEYLKQDGSIRFVEALKDLVEDDPEKYVEVYMKILEYFKPKRAREDGQGNSDTGPNIFISDGNREDAKSALGKFLK